MTHWWRTSIGAVCSITRRSRGFEFEFRDGLDGVTGRGNFRFIRLELVVAEVVRASVRCFLCRSGRKRL